MTDPVFYIDPQDIASLAPGETYELTGPEGHHAKTVKRLGVGEPLDLVDGRGRRAAGVVEEVLSDGLGVSIRSAPRQDPTSRVVLVQALAKGDRDLMAIEMATELGVEEVCPWQADRSIVRWKGDRAAKGRAKWEKTVSAAAKQARRSSIPRVGELLTTAAVGRLAEPGDRMFVLHEEASVSLVERLREPTEHFTGRTFVVVGPEGGISPQEIAALEDAGAQRAVLGTDVLRSSTAGAAAISVINALDGVWDRNRPIR